jgi:acyl-CoA thioesterase-1
MSERTMSERRTPVGRAIGMRTAMMALVVMSPVCLAGCDHRAPAAAADSVVSGAADGDSDVRSLATVPVSRNGGMAADSVPDARVRNGQPTVLFIGTSLTAGYGVDPSDAYPAVVGRMLDSAGRPARIVNAGVSGETSAGARSRIDWVLRQPADVVVLETGANDGLRGLSVDAARANIGAILDRIREKEPSARVLLVQMEAPPNLGATYTSRFRDMYPELAEEHHVELVPFLLGGVAGIASLNQDDGIHPNRAGARIVARTVYNALVRRPLPTTVTR